MAMTNDQIAAGIRWWRKYHGFTSPPVAYDGRVVRVVPLDDLLGELPPFDQRVATLSGMGRHRAQRIADTCAGAGPLYPSEIAERSGLSGASVTHLLQTKTARLLFRREGRRYEVIA